MRRLAPLLLVLSVLAGTAVAESAVGRWQLDEEAVAQRLAASLHRQWHQVPAENADAVASAIDELAVAEAAKLAGSTVLFDVDGRVHFEIMGQPTQDGTWSLEGDVLELMPDDPVGVPLVAQLIGDVLELKPADATGSALFVFRRAD